MYKIHHGLYTFNASFDTNKLTNDCIKAYERLFHLPADEVWTNNDGQPNAPSTLKSLSQYNIFTFPYKSFHNLFHFIIDSFYEAEKTHYGYNLKQHYYIQSWLNVYNKNEFIDWHGHHYNVNWAWHGFFCVDTEPSSTMYKFDDGTEITLPCINNQLYIGICENNKHKTESWPYERPRITIAFDIISVQGLKNVQYNHWIPI